MTRLLLCPVGLEGVKILADANMDTVTLKGNLGGQAIRVEAHRCVECGKITPWGRRKYCSDACMYRFLVRRWRRDQKTKG